MPSGRNGRFALGYLVPQRCPTLGLIASGRAALARARSPAHFIADEPIPTRVHLIRSVLLTARPRKGRTGSNDEGES